MLKSRNRGAILWFKGTSREVTKAALALKELILKLVEDEEIIVVRTDGVKESIDPVKYKIKHADWNSRATRRLDLEPTEGDTLHVVCLKQMYADQVMSCILESADVEFFLKEEFDVYGFHKDGLSQLSSIIRQHTGLQDLPPHTTWKPGKLLISIIQNSNCGVEERKINGITNPNEFELRFTYPVWPNDQPNSGYPSSQRIFLTEKVKKDFAAWESKKDLEKGKGKLRIAV